MIILDEPVHGLDPDGVRWIRGLLKSLAAEGRAVLVYSHLISEIPVTADHLRHLEARRLEIITAARRLFGESGFARTTMADVVAASGLSNGAVSHYFPSKVELVVAGSAGHDGTVNAVAPKETAVRLLNRLIDCVNPDVARDHARLAAQIRGEASLVPRLAGVVRETHVGLQEQFELVTLAELLAGHPGDARRLPAAIPEPGFGVDFDEKAASRFPPVKFRFDRWAAGVRRPDGSLEPRDRGHGSAAS
jgi:AcrR family transcriptional regulator